MPPYEVMGQATARSGGRVPGAGAPAPAPGAPAGPGAPAAGHPPAHGAPPSHGVRDPGRPGAGHPGSAPAPVVVSKAPADTHEPVGFWARAHHPMLLRVPPGLLVMAALAVMGLIVIAYLVGVSRGQSSQGISEVDEVERGQMSRRMAVAPPPGLGATTGNTGTPTKPPAQGGITKPPVQGGPTKPPTSTSGTSGTSGTTGTTSGTAVKPPAPAPPTSAGRQAGMNYMRLAYYPADEAERLAVFMRERQVDTIVVPAESPKFFLVFAVNKGFKGEELGGKVFQEYKTLLLRLGRTWKDDHRGPDALEKMYPVLYRGEPSKKDERKTQ